MMNSWRKIGIAGALIAVVASGCSSGSSSKGTDASTTTTTTTTAAATTTTQAAVTTTTKVVASTSSTAASTTSVAKGDITLDAPASVAAGAKFDVKWTGPNAQGDFITIVAKGTAKWTDEPWFYTNNAPVPRPLVAPVEDGNYELWYVAGDTDAVLARRDITISAFSGALGGPQEVGTGAPFQVAWNGPDGPGDYVTIVKAGTAKWTNESYFYTNAGSPGTLVAPIEPGAYELWYVTGADAATMATAPIVVVQSVITLSAPGVVQHGANFEVKWVGPNGPQDYLTIVPEGSAAGTYTSFQYTTNGSPVTLKAPDAPGKYEIWYASDRVDGTFASIPITVG
jgi:Ca-activated chloride channel family protein